MKNKVITLFLTIFPLIIFAQEESSMGIDERINKKFLPIAEWWEGFILTPLHIAGFNIPIVLILLVLGALFFTLYFGFIQILKFPLAINVVRGKYDHVEKINKGDKELNEKPFVNIVDGEGTIKDELEDGEVSHFQALATAVSGTVGLGNIAGVAVAIAIGGPGATFWMIICGLLGMATKFVECTLAVAYRDVEPDGKVYGGPMYYLSRATKGTSIAGLGKVLAIIFAVMCVGASFGGGTAFQSNQATQQIISMFQIKGGAAGLIIGSILAILVAIVIIGGIKSIAKVTEKIVPFMAITYVLACLIILGSHVEYILPAINQIFKGAFSPEAGLGGIIGVIIVGFQRAAFSNEAGAGSAAIAHSAVKTKFAASEGLVALLEPLIDTVIICTMTALVIIFFNMEATGLGSMFTYGNIDGSNNVILNTPLADGTVALGGVDLTSQAFGSVLPWFPTVLTIAIVLFAFSTMISWSYYGLQAWKYLFGRGKVADLIYKLLFLFFVIVGAAATLDAVIKFSDAMILALVFPNMIGLLLLFPKVKKRLNLYLNAIKADKK